MTNVICECCNHEWEYSGQLQLATCPSCQRKTSVQKSNTANDSVAIKVDESYLIEGELPNSVVLELPDGRTKLYEG